MIGNKINLEIAITNAELFLAYLAESGCPVDKETVDIIVSSAELFKQDAMDKDAEVRFWVALNHITNIARPVTVESLAFSFPSYEKKGEKIKKRKSNAERTVARYRALTIVILILLLLTQIYGLMGSHISSKLKEYAEKQEQLLPEISRIKSLYNVDELDIPGDYPELERLTREEEYITEQYYTNFQLLKQWNKLWAGILSRDSFDTHTDQYEKMNYEKDLTYYQELVNNVQKNIATQPEKKDSLQRVKKRILRKIDYLQANLEQEKTQIRLLMSQHSAELSISILSLYILPLLYGLLGAMLYILRVLAQDIQNLTYKSSSEINYRIRITMGSLSGLIIGWFLQAQDGAGLIASLSPMVLSFLAGYNIEIIFSVMDKALSTVKGYISQENTDEKPEKSK